MYGHVCQKLAHGALRICMSHAPEYPVSLFFRWYNRHNVVFRMLQRQGVAFVERLVFQNASIPFTAKTEYANGALLKPWEVAHPACEE
jgi:hypothetical protein